MTGMTSPRVALVTGSSQGLGRVTAGRLARDGLAVAVNGIHDHPVEHRRDGDPVLRVERGSGSSPRTSPTQPGTWHSYLQFRFDTRSGRRAGRRPPPVRGPTSPWPTPPRGATASTSSSSLLKSPLLLGLALLPGAARASVGPGSGASTPRWPARPPPHRSAYATAKAAQVGLARCSARELAPDGIRVERVAPGLRPGGATSGRRRRWARGVRRLDPG